MIQKFRVSAVRPTLQASCLKSVCHSPPADASLPQLISHCWCVLSQRQSDVFIDGRRDSEPLVLTSSGGMHNR